MTRRWRRSGRAGILPLDFSSSSAQAQETNPETRSPCPRFPVEYDSDRKIRARNKLYYRFNHWPIWIFVFFIAPGPLTFDLVRARVSTRGWRCGSARCSSAPAIAGLRGAAARRASRSPTSSASPRTGRTRSTAASATRSRGARSSPSPLLNIAGLVVAIATGHWYLKQIYRYAYFPLAGFGLAARRARPAAAREGVDQGRGARAPLFLRIGLGGLLGAAGALADVEGRAAHARRATRSSSSCSWPSWPSSATSRASAACRARGRSSRANWPFPTEIARPLTKDYTGGRLSRLLYSSLRFASPTDEPQRSRDLLGRCRDRCGRRRASRPADPGPDRAEARRLPRLRLHPAVARRRGQDPQRLLPRLPRR